jgi:hypothetical protein
MQTIATSFFHRTPRTGRSARKTSERPLYLRLLDWAFAVFNAVRLLTYFPTLLAIQQSGSSSQHSLLTWLIWAGANATMAATLYERNGMHCNKLIGITLANAVQCALACVVVAWYR